MSVMNGFKHELLSRILGLNGHFSLYSKTGELYNYQNARKSIEKNAHVVYSNPLIEKQGLFMANSAACGGIIHGVYREDIKKKSLIANNILMGNLTDENGAVIGIKLARKLRLTVGGTLKIMASETTPTPLGFIPKSRSFRVGAIFETGMHEYDSAFVFIDLPDAQKFFDMKNAVTALEIFVKNPEDATKIRESIEKSIDPTKFLLYDWQQANSHFFAAIQVERNVMFLILTLIIFVAVFNIISCLVMLAKDKTSDIALLRTMGATRAMVLRIFFLAGAYIGVSGTIAGAVTGLLFSYNIESIRKMIESLLGVNLFNDEIYFLSKLPASVDISEAFSVMALSLFLSFCAALYPAWRASKMDPVKALRYE